VGDKVGDERLEEAGKLLGRKSGKWEGVGREEA